jgi:hypothetical protein
MQTRGLVLVAVAFVLLGYLIVIISFLQSNPELPIPRPGLAATNILQPDASSSAAVGAGPSGNLRGDASSVTTNENAPIVDSERSTAAPTDGAESKELSKDIGKVEESEAAELPKTFQFFKPTAVGVVILGMHRSGTSGNYYSIFMSHLIYILYILLTINCVSCSSRGSHE